MLTAPSALNPIIQLENRLGFHAPHLERVSRSFAFGISRLSKPLRASVGLGYLICRILDTVEDARWISGVDQRRAFSEFEIFILKTGELTLADRDSIADWVSRVPLEISDGERQLITASPTIFAEFALLGAEERSALLAPVLSMSRGMTHFTNSTRETGSLRLTSLEDVNVYCFFVAGVVGELLTGLVANDLGPIGLESIWKPATHFGLFLQKVNVLKDQRSDENEGRFLVPDRESLIESLRANACGAFDYLCSIPFHRKDYRLFCAWALYLGLATVPYLRKFQTPTAGETSNATTGAGKLPRVKALALGAEIELSILDDLKLREMFDEAVGTAWPTTRLATRPTLESETPSATIRLGERSPSASTLRVLRDCYSGRLQVDELARLLACNT